MKRATCLRATLASVIGIGCATHPPRVNAVEIGDERAIGRHVLLREVDEGRWPFDWLRLAGEDLFKARFTVLDGAGRPGATGDASPTRRPLDSAPAFVRTAGPEANSCFGCHSFPRVGGSGEFVANVFVGPQTRQPVLLSIDPQFSAERKTPSLFGAGAIELLAREMTQDMHAIRDDALRQALERGKVVRAELVTKGVHFGYLSIDPIGEVSTAEVEGVDKDLVVRPWSQKGTVTSLRTFSITALNHHHGMQASERFGLHITDSTDFDRDGVADEITEGDVTALTVFQAALPIPGRRLPPTAAERELVAEGEERFAAIGCAECHRPRLIIRNPVFEEPGPFNLEGTLRRQEVKQPFRFDLSKEGPGPHLESLPEGGVVVRAFTDLKRHRIADAERPHFGNETLAQGFAPPDEFVTKRLWDVGCTAPYGHRGDLTTLSEAILHHGGEARDARLVFEGLPPRERRSVIAFLQSLQVVPEGGRRIVNADR